METIDEGRFAGYRHQVLRKVVFLAICSILLVVVFAFSLSVGQRNIPVSEVYSYVIAHIQGVTYTINTPEWWNDYVIWNARLPRALVAIVGGAGLSIAGAALQSILKNPLADAYTTGVSSAAVFGVSLAMVMGFMTVGSGQYGIVFNAFLFGLLPVGIMLIMSRFSRISPATLILAGTAVSYLFGSLSTLIMTTADNETLARAYLWQIGSLQDVGWSSLTLMLIVTFVGFVLVSVTSNRLNIMTLGDTTAKGLGVDPENYRVFCLVLVSLMVASIISFTGILAFVGLVMPHIVRMIIGSDNRFVIPGSAILGGLFLLAMDLVSRSIVIPQELPVGIIMSFVGAPIFLYLIVTQKKEIW